MSHSTLTIFTDAFPGADAHLSTAIACGDVLGAHLVIVAMAEEPPFSYLAGAEMAVQSWVDQVGELKKTVQSMARNSAQQATEAGLSAEGRGATALLNNISRSAAKHARYGDLSIVRAPSAEGADLQTEVIDGLLFLSGRPVLVLPEQDAVLEQGGRVVVAWDGSREASRALFDAMAYLKTADEVSIALVEPESGARGLGDEPGADIARTLARHGVTVSVDRLPDLGGGVAAAILKHATGLGARMIVMGGYGHSKLREAVFGGVTRDMLKDVRVPLLMSH